MLELFPRSPTVLDLIPTLPKLSMSVACEDTSQSWCEQHASTQVHLQLVAEILAAEAGATDEY